MNPLEYLRLQLRLEGKEVINGELLRLVEIVPDEEMPLLAIVSLSSDELVVYYDEALAPELRGEFGRRIQAMHFPHLDPIMDILRIRNIEVEIGHYKTYIFPERYKFSKDDDVKRYPRSDPKVEAFGFGGFAEQVHAIEQDGRIVSACVSAKENDRCGEAWVYTDPEYRHQGFAPKVVSSWAGDMMQAGKVPFYSHKFDNLASAQLAKRLGLEPLFEEITISPVAV